MEKSGIEDAVFVHVNGFTGGAKTLEGAIKMLNKSLMKYLQREDQSLK